ncbi:hypothetical protein Tco_0696954 [Tanacetum coccineum]
MGSGQEWSSEDQRDIFILGYVQDDKSMGKINLPILTSTFSAKPLGYFIVLSASSMVNLVCSHPGKGTGSLNLLLCCEPDTAYGLHSIRRISDESAIAVELDLT